MNSHDSTPDDVSADRAAINRAVDASTNRATEALRVAEDIARFVLNDATVTRCCKDLRHELIRLIEQLSPTHVRIRARDIEGDVGTEISSRGEYERADVASLAASNLRRAQQALRSLEEFAKRSHGDLAARLEELRYRLYALEVPFITNLQSQEKLANCPLCVLLDGRANLDEFRALVEQLVAAGAPMIQLRAKNLSDQELWDRARVLVQGTRARGTRSIINDRADLAAAVGADGVHLGQTDLPLAAARRVLPHGALVGISAHSLEQARNALLAGADYLGIGPVFPSRTKQFREPAGLALVRAVAPEIGLPWFAIGGITPHNLNDVLQAGASRVAVSDSVLTAASPGEIVEAFRRQLDQRSIPGIATHA